MSSYDQNAEILGTMIKESFQDNELREKALDVVKGLNERVNTYREMLEQQQGLLEMVNKEWMKSREMGIIGALAKEDELLSERRKNLDERAKRLEEISWKKSKEELKSMYGNN